MFKRFYVCYYALKSGWKAGCRPFIGLDGCFLKTVTGGQLLSAVGRDGNNQMYPICYAIVESESTDSMTWFLTLLIDDLQLGDGHGYTIISDQQKGLEKAVKDLLPSVEHRFCTRHICSNFQKRYVFYILVKFHGCVFWFHSCHATNVFINCIKFLSKLLKALFWNIATATQHTQEPWKKWKETQR